MNVKRKLLLLLSLAAGLAVTGLLCRRDHHPPEPAQEDKPWKKYTDRR